MRRNIALFALLLVACDVFVNAAPVPTPTAARFMPTETPAPTRTPDWHPTGQPRQFHYRATVRQDIPVLNVRNAKGMLASNLRRGDVVIVVGEAESLAGLTVEVASEGAFDGWWCQIEPVEANQWVACDLLGDPEFILDEN